MLTGKDLDDVDVKVKFISGLSSDNKKRAEEFWFKKPLEMTDIARSRAILFWVLFPLVEVM
jgi:hypothetical protein